MMTALNRFPQYASEIAIRDGDWQGIPSSTLLPSGRGGTTVSPKADSCGDFKEDKTDPFVNLQRHVIQHRIFPPTDNHRKRAPVRRYSPRPSP